MSNNFYDSLWVGKSATQDEIKKAYRKKAMKYHPDKNKGDASAEKQFKKINEAYQTLWDEKARKQYDMFWSAKSAHGGGNPFWWGSWAWFGWFEEMFWWAAGWAQAWGFNFNMEDLFGQWGQWGSPFGNAQSHSRQQPHQEPEKEETLDFEKTYEIPIFDLMLWCSIEVRWVYGQTKKIKIPEWTKPGTKMRVKDFWKTEGTQKWNLLITLEGKMPKSISEVDRSMLERIRDGVWY